MNIFSVSLDVKKVSIVFQGVLWLFKKSSKGVWWVFEWCVKGSKGISMGFYGLFKYISGKF